MKKVFYVLLFALASTISITSCTEEEVAPVSETNNGGATINTGEV